jgi:radical SAM superfamily enzyme YgiQ (UPF0313 family)
MKIVFFDPGFGERSWNTYGQSHWSSIIHQGLCGLSTCAKEAGFTDCHLMDIRMLQSWEHLEARFRELDPDVVALTMRSFDYQMDIKIARRLKAVKPEVVIVVGGVHVSIDPEFCQGVPEYDYIIGGEGEITFVKLLQALKQGEPFPRYSVGERPDLDRLPFIDRELYPYTVSINLPNYEGVFRPPMITMICSRGCPFRCTFCYPHSKLHFGGKVRYRSVDNVMAELELLQEKYRFECVKFYDYSFTLNPEWAWEFARSYRKLSKPFWIQSRADLIVKEPDLIRELAGVGLEMVGVGFESGSDKVLRDLRKGSTREINLQAARIVKEAGVFLSGSFMLGTPSEEEEDLQATISMVKEMRPDFISVSFFTPIPGNELYHECKEKGLIIKDDPEMWIDFSPEVPKIKGKDYDRLREAAAEIIGTRFGSNLLGKIVRWFYVKTKSQFKLRSALVWMYGQWAKLRRGVPRHA